jgi:hypothetical protein
VTTADRNHHVHVAASLLHDIARPRAWTQAFGSTGWASGRNQPIMTDRHGKLPDTLTELVPRRERRAAFAEARRRALTDLINRDSQGFTASARQASRRCACG